MPSAVSPQKLQRAAHLGIERFKNFRNARVMFLRNYVGQYYDQASGQVGTEALNLIYNAIRNLIPNIVMNFPKHTIESRFLANKDYGELLELALSDHDKKIKIRDVYRRVIVDSIFTLGILKTGLAESDSVYALDAYDHIDVGEIYTECVDFDNFVVDPNSREHMFRDAAFMGDKICVPRQKLLESGLYNNDLIMRLPRVGGQHVETKAEEFSRHKIRDSNPDLRLQEEVELIELWVPEADAVVTIPGAKDIVLPDFLRVDDYYGPDDGPYTFLSMSPPVPGNPLPVPMVGVWNDLHTLSNRMAKKIIDQAERQKDIVGYRRAAADDAQEALDASDGEAVAMEDPDGLRVHSFGGQQQSNEVHLASLNNWFNMVASNPEALAGQRFDSSSATEARILANNANIGLEDAKDLVYQMGSTEARKRAWYMHTDPFINLPLVRRVEIPPTIGQGPMGPTVLQPGQLVDVQVYLTPEARSGDFLDFSFDIRPESMGRKDSQARYLEAMDFAVKILPAALQAAQAALMMGIPFSAKEFVIRMAKDRGIDWMEEVFYDPEFQIKWAIMMSMGPQAEGSQGVPGPPSNPLAALMQNGQPGQVMGNPSAGTRERQGEQQGAVDAQRLIAPSGGGY